MNWFRLYVEVLDDPKVQSLEGDTFKRWINALCIARKHGGVLPSLDVTAFYLRLPVSETENILNRLEAAGLLDRIEAGLVPHNWSSRQYASDDPTAYVRRFRAKRKSSQNSEKRVQSAECRVQNTDTEEKYFLKRPGNISVSKGRLAPVFDKFWAMYPRKVGKAAARKAFDKAAAKVPSEQITAALKAQLPDLQSREQQFVPHAGTWLNQERWNDEPEAPRPTNGKGSPLDRFAAHRAKVDETFDELMMDRLGTGDHVSTVRKVLES